MIQYLTLADMQIRWISAPKNLFGDFWRWKLDPFMTDCAADPYLTVRFGHLQKGLLDWRQINSDEGQVLQKIPDGFFCRQWNRTDAGDLIWSMTEPNAERVVLQFAVSPDWRKIDLVHDETDTSGQAAFEALAFLMPGVFLQRDVLSFHGALFEYKGVGFAVSADSGVGKTTHVRLWRDLKNALVINGDRTTCRKADGKWNAYGIPWSGTSGETVNRKVPLGAHIVLERAEKNFVEKLPAENALPGLLANAFCPTWHRQLVSTCMKCLDAYLRDIPVYCLHCRPDAGAVDTMCEALYRDGVLR